MHRYAIAFIAPTDKLPLRHKILQSEDKDSALRDFFNQEVSEFYSNDEQGFYYFKEDFYDESTAAGSILELEAQ